MWLASFVVLLLGTATAAAQRVEVDFDKAADFSRLKTFAWDPDNPLPPSLSEFDGNRIDIAIRDSVERALKAKGLFQVMRQADFLVSFTVTGRPREASGEAAPSEAPAEGEAWRPFQNASAGIETAREGAVVLSVLDGATRRVLWQARAIDMLESGKKLERRIDGGVKKMLKSFPPR